MIKLSARCVLLAAEFMAVQDVRQCLNGIQVERHPKQGALLIGTNGHMAIIVHDEEGECEEKSVIVSPSKQALVALRKLKGSGVLMVDEDPMRRQLSILNESLVTHFIQPEPALIDARFPDWRRIVPAADKLHEGLVGAFQTAYIRHICDAVAKYCPNRYGAFVRWYCQPYEPSADAPFEEPHHAAVFNVTSDTGLRAFGVLMPGRAGIHKPIPDWFPAEQQDAAAA